MLETIRSYFRQEFIESWFFVAVGVIAIARVVWLLYSGNSYKGAAWPLISVAVIQLSVGLGVGLRTPKQVAAWERNSSMAPPISNKPSCNA